MSDQNTPKAPNMSTALNTEEFEKTMENLLKELTEKGTQEDLKLIKEFVSMGADKRKEITPRLTDLIETQDETGLFGWILEHPWKTASIVVGMAALGYGGYHFFLAGTSDQQQLDANGIPVAPGPLPPDTQYDNGDLLH